MLKAYWEQKSTYEKDMILLIIFAITVFLLFLLIWLPLHYKKTQLQDHFSTQQQLLVWMEKQAPLLKTARNTKVNPNQKDIFSVIESNVKPFADRDKKLSIVRISESKASISFNEIPFDNLINQLIILKKEYNINVDEIEVNRLDKQGIVNGKVILSYS